MESIFCKKRWTLAGNILGLVSGIFLPVLFGFVMMADPAAEPGSIAAALFFSVFGLLVALLCGVSIYVNKKAFVRADSEGIIGYFHIGRAMQCSYDEIDAVSFGGTGLNIRLKNGKKYGMMNLDNALDLGRFIKNRMPLPPLSSRTTEELHQTLRDARARRKKCSLGLLGCFVLIFGGILPLVQFTGGKELADFTAADWQIFGVMIGWELVLMTAIVILIRKVVRHSEVCQRNLEELHLLVLRTAPLPAGNMRHVYISLDDHPPVRVTVCGLPQSREVYYILEGIRDDDTLEKFHESKLYPNLEALEPELEGLTEISFGAEK